MGDHFPILKISGKSLDKMAQKWLDLVSAVKLSEEERAVLFGPEAFSVEKLKRLLCPSCCPSGRRPISGEMVTDPKVANLISIASFLQQRPRPRTRHPQTLTRSLISSMTTLSPHQMRSDPPSSLHAGFWHSPSALYVQDTRFVSCVVEVSLSCARISFSST